MKKMMKYVYKSPYRICRVKDWGALDKSVFFFNSLPILRIRVPGPADWARGRDYPPGPPQRQPPLPCDSQPAAGPGQPGGDSAAAGGRGTVTAAAAHPDNCRVMLWVEKLGCRPARGPAGHWVHFQLDRAAGLFCHRR